MRPLEILWLLRRISHCRHKADAIAGQLSSQAVASSLLVGVCDSGRGLVEEGAREAGEAGAAGGACVKRVQRVLVGRLV